MKKIKILVLFFAFPFIGLAQNSNQGGRDCEAYALKMVAAIEQYYECLDADDYNETYIGFRDFCRFLSVWD